MWLLVMLLTLPNGQQFSAHPKPMSETECRQAMVAVAADLQTKVPKEIKTELKCLPWNTTGG